MIARLLSARELPAWLYKPMVSTDEIAIWWGTAAEVCEYRFGHSIRGVRFLWMRRYRPAFGTGAMIDRDVYDLPPEVLIAAGVEGKRRRGGK